MSGTATDTQGVHTHRSYTDVDADMDTHADEKGEAREGGDLGKDE